MDEAREFQGKNLDAAIGDACTYFQLPREQLAIEILHDAKSGIFGIVGTRKAAILAKPAHVKETVLQILSDTHKKGSSQPKARKEKPKQQKDLTWDIENLPSLDIHLATSESFQQLVSDILAKITSPIAEIKEFSFTFSDGKLCVHLASGSDSGLLIGREGQTLSAVQYVAARIISRKVSANVRLQLDAGEYRQRQETKLKEIALNLAAKARQTGRSFSTKPLSAYDRRLVHRILETEADIHSHSVGDGAFRRVIILCKRAKEKKSAQTKIRSSVAKGKRVDTKDPE